MSENRYEGLTREQLIDRLALAEDVCVLVGWTAVRRSTDRDEALAELWMRWAEVGDSSHRGNRHLTDGAIRELAERRRATRRATLERATR